MDNKNWFMVAVTVGALVMAFTVVPALADDPDDADPIPGYGDWAEMAEYCQSEDGHDHDDEHMDECLAGDGVGMMDGGMMDGGMMSGGMMGGGMMGGDMMGGGMTGGGMTGW